MKLFKINLNFKIQVTFWRSGKQRNIVLSTHIVRQVTPSDMVQATEPPKVSTS